MQPERGGLIIEPIKDSDWIMGVESGIEPQTLNAEHDWDNLLAEDEWQKKYWETNSCVSFSAVKQVTMYVNYLANLFLEKHLFREDTEQALKDLGFIINGRFNASDRFIAKLSGTTKNGNSFMRVWDAIRHNGLVPETDWPWPSGTFNTHNDFWNEYMKDVPQSVIDKGSKFLDLLEVQYEWVLTGTFNADKLILGLEQAPLQIGTPVCIPDWNNENVPACPGVAASHATVLYGFDKYKSWNIHDQYAPFKKKLAWDYSIPYAIKGILKEKKPKVETPFSHLFTKKIKFGDGRWEPSFEVSCLQEVLRREGLMIILPTGYFGPITQQAVKDFQYKYAVAPLAELQQVNGKEVGPATRRKLNELYAPTTGVDWFSELITKIAGLFR